MAIRGALALGVLSILLVLALSDIAHALPRTYRVYTVLLFFPGFFFVVGIAMRFAEARLSSVTDWASAMKDGRDLFLAWSTYLLAMILVTGAISFLLF